MHKAVGGWGGKGMGWGINSSRAHSLLLNQSHWVWRAFAKYIIKSVIVYSKRFVFVQYVIIYDKREKVLA